MADGVPIRRFGAKFWYWRWEPVKKAAPEPFPVRNAIQRISPRCRPGVPPWAAGVIPEAGAQREKRLERDLRHEEDGRNFCRLIW